MSIEDEYAVIGFAMNDNVKEYHERVVAELTEDHFSTNEGRIAYRIVCELVSEGHKPSFRNVANRMTDMQDIVIDMFKAAGNSNDAGANFQALHVESQRKAYQRMALMLHELTNGHNFSIEQAESILTNFVPFRPAAAQREYMVEASEAADIARQSLDKARQNPGQISGVRMSYDTSHGAKVGFNSLDFTMNGLRGGDFIILAAQSGHGKTALAMNLTRIMSYHNNRRVYYLNTEMDLTQMVYRWVSMVTRIDYERLDRGEVSDAEMLKYNEWDERFRQSPLTVSRIPSLSTDLVKGLAKQAIQKHGHLDCLIVDYIGRMNLENTRNLQEYQILSHIAKALKETAIELNIPIIALAQLNEEGKLEGAKKMRNECDGLFFFKPRMIEGTDANGNETVKASNHEFYIVKEKVRRGSTEGIIRCEFDKPYQFIREV